MKRWEANLFANKDLEKIARQLGFKVNIVYDDDNRACGAELVMRSDWFSDDPKYALDDLERRVVDMLEAILKANGVKP